MILLLPKEQMFYSKSRCLLSQMMSARRNTKMPIGISMVLNTASMKLTYFARALQLAEKTVATVIRVAR